MAVKRINKTKQIAFNVTEADYQRVIAECEKTGLSLSAFVRITFLNAINKKEAE